MKSTLFKISSVYSFTKLTTWIILLVVSLSLIAPIQVSAGCFCYYNTPVDQYCTEYKTIDDAYCDSNCRGVYNTTDEAYAFSVTGSDSADRAVCDASDETTASTATTPSTSKSLITPTLAIEIPDFKFTDGVIDGSTIRVDYLGQYIAAVYKWLIGVSTFIAIVMLMIGGLQYAFGGVSDNAISSAKKRIKDAVSGLVLLLSTVLILTIVNPALVSLSPIELDTIETIPEEEDDVVAGTLAVTFASPTESNISGNGKSQVPESISAKVDAAAKELAANKDTYGMFITSSFRTGAKQVELVELNCQNPPGIAPCNPKPGRPNTCVLLDLDPANCPHTSGYALDIWGTDKNGLTCISQATCINDKTACRANPCQAALLTAMENAGFCNLASEPWHFEQPKMSSTCN